VDQDQSHWFLVRDQDLPHFYETETETLYERDRDIFQDAAFDIFTYLRFGYSRYQNMPRPRYRLSAI